VFTIHFYDGNRFFARQARQSWQSRRTRTDATFMQQFDCKPAKLRESFRDISATLGSNALRLRRFSIRTAGIPDRRFAALHARSGRPQRYT